MEKSIRNSSSSSKAAPWSKKGKGGGNSRSSKRQKRRWRRGNPRPNNLAAGGTAERYYSVYVHNTIVGTPILPPNSTQPHTQPPTLNSPVVPCHAVRACVCVPPHRSTTRTARRFNRCRLPSSSSSSSSSSSYGARIHQYTPLSLRHRLWLLFLLLLLLLLLIH